MAYLRLPRNYQFFSRLPLRFYIEVEKRVNQTNDGIWFFVRIDQHQLNLLSKIELIPGKKYLVKKKDKLTLELISEEKTGGIDPGIWA